MIVLGRLENMAVQEVKICPECNCDYRPHIDRCVNCGEDLVWLEEHRRLQEEEERLRSQALENPVAVREGEIAWIDELHEVLIATGIPCRIHADPGCAKGCRGHAVRLLVSRQDLERAHERCEEYFAELHPEARVSQEMMRQGKCPACGSSVAPKAVECPDCGLALLTIIE